MILKLETTIFMIHSYWSVDVVHDPVQQPKVYLELKVSHYTFKVKFFNLCTVVVMWPYKLANCYNLHSPGQTKQLVHWFLVDRATIIQQWTNVWIGLPSPIYRASHVFGKYSSVCIFIKDTHQLFNSLLKNDPSYMCTDGFIMPVRPAGAFIGCDWFACNS